MTITIPEVDRWRVYVRQSTGAGKGFSPPFYRTALIDDYHRFESRLRFNDIGTWTIELPFSSQSGEELRTDGAGIQVLFDESTVFSGSVVSWVHDWNEEEDLLTVNGTTDDVWLDRRVAHMEPTTNKEISPGLETVTQYSSAEYHIFSGACEDVLIHFMSYNCGPSALAPRRFIGANPTSSSRGGTVIGRARMQSLLTLLQELAHSGGDLGFRVLHQGTFSSPTFEVYEPADLTREVVFSEERGNLISYTFAVSAPKANFVYLGGPEEGTSRYFLLDADNESASDVDWGRIESFQDARDIQGTPPDDTEMQLRAVAFLAENAEQTDLHANITGTFPGARFPTDFGLGDTVGVELPEQSFDAVVRAVRLTLDGETGVEITAEVGSQAEVGHSLDEGDTGRAIRYLHSRMLNLERR